MSNSSGPTKLKVLVFAASLRVESLNRKLAVLAARIALRVDFVFAAMYPLHGFLRIHCGFSAGDYLHGGPSIRSFVM
jgi:hypothetical protein